MNFAETLDTIMLERGYTKYRVAKIIGVSQSTIANWLSGKTEPYAKEWDHIAQALGLSVEDLFYYDENKKAPIQKNERDQDMLLQMARTTMLVQEFEKLSPEDQNDFLAQLIVKARTPADPADQK